MSRSCLRVARSLLLALAVPLIFMLGGAQSGPTMPSREPLVGTWLPYHGNHPSVLTAITVKPDGTASFSGAFGGKAGRLDVVSFQAKFESWTRVRGSIAYTIYWSASGPGTELPPSFNPDRPGNVNVNRCATPTIPFDAYYGLR